MHRKFKGNTLLLATHNNNKLIELQALFTPLNINLISAKKMNLSQAEENGNSFRENAEIKAFSASIATRIPAMGDDSGLVIPALDGKPGIYSARWAGKEQNFTRAMEYINYELEKNKTKNPKAYFVCGLALSWPDKYIEYVQATCAGNIIWPPRGKNGFGYDPIFVPEGYSITYAEMSHEQKYRISHRTKAFKLIIQNCFI